MSETQYQSIQLLNTYIFVGDVAQAECDGVQVEGVVGERQGFSVAFDKAQLHIRTK